MKEFLQGKWLGHPLHAVLVHLPISLWPLAFVTDVLANFGRGDNAFVQISFYAIGLGLASAGLAALTGLADWLGVKRRNPAWKVGLYHLILNVILIILWEINFMLRLNTFSVATTVPMAALVLSAVGTMVLGVSGWLGGRMVYDYGVSVGRASKDRWQIAARAGGANVPSE